MNEVGFLEKVEVINLKKILMSNLKNDYVRVKNIYCGICGGDYSKYIGNRDKYNITLGHEFIAVIIEVGIDVINFSVGDLVVSDINFRCGECYYCKNNLSHLCDLVDIEFFSNRSFAKYSDYHFSYLIKVNNLQKNILSGINVEPLSCVIHAFNTYDIKTYTNILIVGAGNIGSLACFYLSRCLNHSNIYIKELKSEKMNFVIEHFDCKAYSDEVDYDLIFEATDDIEGLIFSLNKIKKGGQLCSISHLYGINTSIVYEIILKKEIKINFPLRNGDKINLYKAYNLIDVYWKEKYNSCIELHDISEINEGFISKKTSYKNKQAISMI